MDPLALAAAAINLATEAIKARSQWWESLSPEKRNQLADKHADAELRWLTFLELFTKDLKK